MSQILLITSSRRLELRPDRRAYVHLVRGNVSVNGIPLITGDTLQVTDTQSLVLSDGQAAEVMVFDLPA
jgi:hypothetical protein